VAAADKLKAERIWHRGRRRTAYPIIGGTARKTQVDDERPGDDDTTPVAGDAALDLARLDNRAIAFTKMSPWGSMPATRTASELPLRSVLAKRERS
jgi:hypothetical protein